MKKETSDLIALLILVVLFLLTAILVNRIVVMNERLENESKMLEFYNIQQRKTNLTEN